MLISSASSVNLPQILSANGMGAFLVFLILTNWHRRNHAAGRGSGLFIAMCYTCMFLCIIESLSFYIDGAQFPGARQLALVLNSLLFAFSSVFAYTWCIFVNSRLYSTRPRHTLYFILSIPAICICVMCVVNLFVPIFFSVTSDNYYSRTRHVLLTYLVSNLYLIHSATVIFRFRKRSPHVFMPLISFLIPIVVGNLLQFAFYGISTIWPSVAYGMTSLYLHLKDEHSFMDVLTNLYNRSYLVQYTEYLHKQREKGVRIHGIMLDVNNFKNTNDTFGHQIGDEVLIALARILQSTVRKTDVVARYGGDEFIILLENSTDEMCSLVEQRIEQDLASFNRHSPLPCPIMVSMGSAEYTQDCVEAFFREMDLNMYARKRAFHERRCSCGNSDSPSTEENM